ncbi:MAG: GGDEF domain-containing protein, partial [Spirochaetota bacterium]
EQGSSTDEQGSSTDEQGSSDDGFPHKLFVPLVVRGTAVGVLAISRAAGGFAGEEVRIAMSMADYLSLALSNARLYSHMQQRAEIDQLTGVLTRRAFMESGEQVMDQAFHAGQPLCACILDIDHFKPINDTFGHSAGDQVLRTLGSVMRDSLRSTDMVGRFGGEEFCALLTDTELGDGFEVAERLRHAIESTAFAGINRQVTASIGIAYLAPGPGAGGGHEERADQGSEQPSRERPSRERLSIEQIIQRADIALYNAKESGRNRVVAYEEGMKGE